LQVVSEGQGLVGAGPLGFVEEGFDGATLVDGVVFGVPVGDGGFAELPAEQDGAAVGLKWEVEEAFFEVLHADADLLNLFEGVLGFLCGFEAFALAAGGERDVDVEAAGEEYLVAEALHVEGGAGFAGGCGLGAAEQCLQDGEEGLSFAEGEGFGHACLSSQA
jgi:hypothetical protein